MDQIEIHWVWWLVAAVGLGVIEILTLDLVLLMFAVGALAAIVSSMLGADVTGQVLTFAITSLLMLVFIRPYLLRNLRRRTPVVETNAAAHVGRQARTITEVTDRSGLVKLTGEDWSARTPSPDVVVPPDTPVREVAIDGATAVVEPLERPPGADAGTDPTHDPEDRP